MAFAEISVDQKYHPHIIGKNGANGKQRLCETSLFAYWVKGSFFIIEF